MGLPCRPTLSASVLMPLVVSATPCYSAVVTLCCGWVSSGTSVGLIVVGWVCWDPDSSTAASIRLITLPMVGAAPLAPRSLYFAYFLARVVLRIWWRLLWGGDVDSCGWWYEKWGWCCEICCLHRLWVCRILWWWRCVCLRLLCGHREHREAFFKFCFHLCHICFCLRCALSVLGDCLRE